MDEDDAEFVLAADHEEDDDEATLEQEEKDTPEDQEEQQRELQNLEDEANIPIEQLLARYGIKSATPTTAVTATVVDESEDMNSTASDSSQIGSEREDEGEGEEEQDAGEKEQDAPPQKEGGEEGSTALEPAAPKESEGVAAEGT